MDLGSEEILLLTETPIPMLRGVGKQTEGQQAVILMEVAQAQCK